MRDLTVDIAEDDIFKSYKVNETIKRIKMVHGMYFDKQCTKKGLLIYGASGEGKTHLLKAYKKLFKPVEDIEKKTIPVFYYAVRQGKSNVNDFMKTLISALGGPPIRNRPHSSELETQFITLLKEQEVELIILDEIQNLSTSYDGILFQSIIKYLCWLLDEDAIQCSIVFAGSQLASRLMSFGEHNMKLNDNEQLSRRMLRPIPLRRHAPKQSQWTDCVDWYLKQIKGPELDSSNVLHQQFYDRVYVAYQEKSMSTLNDLFIQENCMRSPDLKSLYQALSINFNLYCKSTDNPFVNLSEIQWITNSILEAKKRNTLEKSNHLTYSKKQTYAV
ncbi:TniB family NTP-binding protein [Shewanella sp. 1_MG-2023]|uniref:TniB family NTP-binding protein n=1 Tax=unclassified Shewanella TaxID=196818 RepID=UPI0026E2A53F|nr:MULTISPECIES: TniB family NTP-binding protein [unclassified Shewanella]MDO6613721.1 TniB family NTP-binding protein [Shewanella sp. 7_MG-2023]MDO6773684.1 TniB family NTP-binding protein [Shewanella sp. 2_MG-2023]MDO6796743.1 TniB family NTP-binding protein [Shewanella sp. 1_MG-2023]